MIDCCDKHIACHIQVNYVRFINNKAQPNLVYNNTIRPVRLRLRQKPNVVKGSAPSHFFYLFTLGVFPFVYIVTIVLYLLFLKRRQWNRHSCKQNKHCATASCCLKHMLAAHARATSWFLPVAFRANICYYPFLLNNGIAEYLYR